MRLQATAVPLGMSSIAVSDRSGKPAGRQGAKIIRSRILTLRRWLRPAGEPLLPDNPARPDEGEPVDGDPVTLAVLSGRSSGHEGLRADRAVHLRAKELFESARRGIEPERNLDSLLQLIRDYPNEERLQILAARLLDARHYAGSADIWDRLVERLPHSETVIVENIRRTVRN